MTPRRNPRNLSVLEHIHGEALDWRAILVAGLCTYEVTAIATGKVPTITAVWHKLREDKIGRLGLWLALGWLIEHLFGEGR